MTNRTCNILNGGCGKDKDITEFDKVGRYESSICKECYRVKITCIKCNKDKRIIMFDKDSNICKVCSATNRKCNTCKIVLPIIEFEKSGLGYSNKCNKCLTTIKKCESCDETDISKFNIHNTNPLKYSKHCITCEAASIADKLALVDSFIICKQCNVNLSKENYGVYAGKVNKICKGCLGEIDLRLKGCIKCSEIKAFTEFSKLSNKVDDICKLCKGITDNQVLIKCPRCRTTRSSDLFKDGIKTCTLCREQRRKK
jgi:hypothetical protein